MNFMILTIVVVLGLVAAIATQIKTGEAAVAVMVILSILVLNVGFSLYQSEAHLSDGQDFAIAWNSGR